MTHTVTKFDFSDSLALTVSFMITCRVVVLRIGTRTRVLFFGDLDSDSPVGDLDSDLEIQDLNLEVQ